MTDPAPGISVVVPTYNRAALIPLTLDAILGQTVSPREVIVVDDGSQDETTSVLARYAPRVRALRIANSGDLVARNTGLRAAGGALVAFCDSDDLWRPEFLAEMVALFRAEPRANFAYGDFFIVRDGRWEGASKFADAPPGYWEGLRTVGPALGVFDRPIVERLIGFQPFFPSCLVVRRDFFRDIGGWDEGVSRVIGCDFSTALRLAEHAPFGVVAKPLVGIRKHGGNISGDGIAMNLGDSRVLEHVLATRPSLAPYAAAIRASIGARRRQALSAAFARRDFANVRVIYPLLPRAQRSGGIVAKRAVASLPLGRAIAKMLLALGTLRTRAHN